MKVDWGAEYDARHEAPIGTLFYFGKCNYGRDENILPLVRRTKTQMICSDGKRTERAMMKSGAVVGMPWSARVMRHESWVKI